MKNPTLCIITIFTIAGSSLFSQDTASVVWPLTSITTVNATTSGQVTGENEFFRNMEINQYTGFNSSQRSRIIGNAWPLNQTVPIDTVFVQFTARPKPGITFTVSMVKVYLAGNSGSNMRAKVFYSTDSTFTAKTEIYAGTASLPNNTAFDSAIGTLNTIITDERGLYIRIYPWLHNQTGSNTGKYLLLQNILIAGTTTGSAVIDLPTISTSAVANISTTYAVCGGNISNDGGGAVSVRGICWDTTANPTVAKNSTTDGSGSGLFTSVASNLQPGKKYFLRAYATNSAGTAYGSELNFTTLTAKTVPIIATTAVSNILAVTALSGGNVTAWGGDTIVARGVCWNTTGNPTTSDQKTTNGTGTGSFASQLVNLTPNSVHYVKAYAVNGIGTGYGNEVFFTTQQLAPDITKIVAKSGGDHTTVQEAFNAVPDHYTGRYIIYVKKGTYKEKLLLTQNKVNVVLIGEHRDSTILTYDDYAGIAGGTSTSYSVAIDADDFTAMNITFQNTVKNDGTFADQQGVALRVNGDRQAYYNCNLLGYQDTYYTWGGRGTGRTYHKNCTIEGSVDFIFGRNIVVFDSCIINVNRNNGTLTAASTETASKFGYVFLNSTITTDSIGFDGNPITTFSLGRPWQASPRTVFLNSAEPANLNPAGWLAWNVPPALYAEYNCTGPGYKPAQRAAWSSQLTDSAAAAYTIRNIFSRNSAAPAYAFDWVPQLPSVPSVLSEKKNDKNQAPSGFRLEQNYPNPFNPSTTMAFSVETKSSARLVICNMLGQRIAVLYNETAEPGRIYSVRFDAKDLSSGVYFSILESNGMVIGRKIVLMK